MYYSGIKFQIVKFRTIYKNDFLDKHQNMLLFFKIKMVSYHTIIYKK